MKNCLYILYIGLLGILISSCQQSLEEVQLKSAKAQVAFTVAMNDLDSRSRSSWENNDKMAETDEGTVDENQIDLNSEAGLQVFVYDVNGNLLGKVANKEIFKLSDNTYKFNGELFVENLQSEILECCLMVYANCTASIDTFAYDTQYIPMWGVKKTILNLSKGELTDINEPVYLLRSMAKVEVKLDQLIAEDFDLTSVCIDKYNMIGNVLPAYETLLDVEYMDQQAVFNPTTHLADDSLSFKQIPGEDAFFIYLPEYDNSNPATVTVIIDDKSYAIEFKNYVAGKPSGNPYNIVRNHCYQYTITSVNTNIDVILEDLSYQSIPWQDVNNGGLIFGDENGDVMN